MVNNLSIKSSHFCSLIFLVLHVIKSSYFFSLIFLVLHVIKSSLPCHNDVSKISFKYVTMDSSSKMKLIKKCCESCIDAPRPSSCRCRWLRPLLEHGRTVLLRLNLLFWDKQTINDSKTFEKELTISALDFNRQCPVESIKDITIMSANWRVSSCGSVEWPNMGQQWFRSKPMYHVWLYRYID